MAVMWPRRIPPEILANPLRRAECKVFARLQEELPDDFEVFYSRPWFGVDRLGEEIDGECDFVVAHSDHGLLALEVKGGGISRNPETEVWYTTDRYGIRSRIKNPVQQAVSSKHKLLAKLLKLDVDLGWVRARHGVVFPDAEEFHGDLSPDLPRRIVCCEQEFEHAFGEWIRQRLDDPEAGGRPLGDGFRQRGVACLRELLAKPIHLGIPLGKRLRGDDQELQVLTQQQFHILEIISQIDRVAVMGGAGTGKTILAVEEALRLARSGNRTALVCFNRGLAESLRNMPKVREQPNLVASTLHSLVWRSVGRDAGTQESGDDGLPTLDAIRAAADSGTFPPLDALVVDEGQDFPPEWWDSAIALLRPGGWLRVFWDSNQSVYSALPTLPAGTRLIPIVLNRNLRNTRSIWNAALPFYAGPTVDPLGPPGVSPLVHILSSRLAVMRELAALVRDWLHDSAPGDLAILVPDVQWRESIRQLLREKGIQCRKCDETGEGLVTVDTVRRFKGLEARDVLLVLDENSATVRELVYVGLTRARVRLAVITTVPVPGLEQAAE